MADVHSKTQGMSPEPPRLNHEWCAEVILLSVCRKYILVESRQKTFHLLRLLRPGWLLTQQQKRHSISALLHFNTLASHAASVSTRPPPPPPPPLTPALYHSESKKGKIKDFSGAPSRLVAEPGATCCAFAPVCWCAHVWEDPSSEGSKGAGCYRTTAIGAREQEFSTGVSLLKIHCQSVETQAKKERWWEGADRGNNKHRRLDVRVDHGPRPTAVGGGGGRTASLKWQWIKSIKKRRRHCLGVCGVGANWVRGHSETNQKPI